MTQSLSSSAVQVETKVTRIAVVEDSDNRFKAYKTKSTIPQIGFMAQYDLDTSAFRLVVLHEYGDETLSDEMKRRLYDGTGGQSLPIAIDRKTGVVFRVFYAFKDWALRVVLARVSAKESKDGVLRVPKKYLREIDRLKTMKRPFRFTLQDWQYARLYDRESGFSDIYGDLTLVLNFPDFSVEIHNGEAREIKPWKKVT